VDVDRLRCWKFCLLLLQHQRPRQNLSTFLLTFCQKRCRKLLLATLPAACWYSITCHVFFECNTVHVWLGSRVFTVLDKKTTTRQSPQWLVGCPTAHSTRERCSSPFLGLEPAASLHSSLAARSTRWRGR